MLLEIWPTFFFTTSCHCESLGTLLKDTDGQARLKLSLNPLFPATRNFKISQKQEDLVSLGRPHVWGAGRWGLMGRLFPSGRHIGCRLWKSWVPSYQLPVTWLCLLVQIVKGQNMKKKSIFWELGIVLVFGLHIPNTCVSGLTLNPPCYQWELVLPQWLAPSLNITNK